MAPRPTWSPFFLQPTIHEAFSPRLYQRKVRQRLSILISCNLLFILTNQTRFLTVCIPMSKMVAHQGPLFPNQSQMGTQQGPSGIHATLPHISSLTTCDNTGYFTISPTFFEGTIDPSTIYPVSPRRKLLHQSHSQGPNTTHTSPHWNTQAHNSPSRPFLNWGTPLVFSCGALLLLLYYRVEVCRDTQRYRTSPCYGNSIAVLRMSLTATFILLLPHLLWFSLLDIAQMTVQLVFTVATLGCLCNKPTHRSSLSSSPSPPLVLGIINTTTFPPKYSHHHTVYYISPPRPPLPPPHNPPLFALKLFTFYVIHTISLLLQWWLRFIVRVCSWGLDLQFYSTGTVNKEMCP